MRHLIYVHEASGNYVHAERSLDAYLRVVENQEKAPLGTRDDITRDIDCHEDTLRTMATGIRILVKYQNKGKKALEIAQKMEQYAKSGNATDPEVLGRV
jgi:hypothetical protein